ncbi:CO or xanthine dehydrogenase, FAD-binding subunit [Sporobacter termitidis DSM 10068]|uniref:CO or xanthine dehydrogenase, FAD-binding subunit n=1 Tax=Sporobacter termitidis DSM 10068 TaxID=1123282 RepID=A0A1M5YCB4_9FIRM|nr:FAD binding domain-containing protein [Sporobacter termitidis]SHI09612.1 CO or xanthine dehydrogenase, FAD-binding subunit [Sporobacter termitidis DSM 10068]
MIPFDFEYYRPDTLGEAVGLFGRLEDEGKNPVWYGGGSELISMARAGNAAFGAVLDIKDVPELLGLGTDGENLTFGAALTLSDLIVSGSFPLLGKTAGRIADHTMQNKITLGGNLASTIIYRETALPLLLADAILTAAGKDGLHTYPIDAVFDGRLRLPKGEVLVRTAVPAAIAAAPYFHQKKTKNEKIDYPLLTTAAVVTGGRLRIAFSGLAPYPFRDRSAEEILNDGRLGADARAELFVKALSGVIQSDLSGSADYRKFVLKDTILNILEAVREEKLPCLC